jgi:ribose-phosphate pyrophosphokinase
MPVNLKCSSSIAPFLEQWKFPGGEVGVKLLNPHLVSFKNHYTVELTGIPTSDDLVVLLNTVDALHRLGVPCTNIQVYIPYLPYARQDRVCNDGESYALQVFCSILGSAANKFSTLIVVDVHSDKSKIFLNGVFETVNYVNQHSCTRYLPLHNAIVAPDKGAVEKAKFTQPDALHINLDKVREGFNVFVDIAEDKHNKIIGSACVVDDICDGGATFISAAQILRKTQPHMTALNLYVTHGIFSKGVDKLLEYYDNIYCYNIMSSDEEVLRKVKKI